MREWLDDLAKRAGEIAVIGGAHDLRADVEHGVCTFDARDACPNAAIETDRDGGMPIDGGVLAGKDHLTEGTRGCSHGHLGRGRVFGSRTGPHVDFSTIS